MLRAIDVAWAAGFIEGEGNVSRQRNTVMPKITAVQVQKEPLERLQHLFGGGLYFSPAQVTHGRNNSGKWIWFQSGRRAVEACLTMYGLMSPKRRQQIDYALANWRISPVRRENNGSRCKNGHLITGANARVAGHYKGRVYHNCRACEKEANLRRSDREKRGRLLIPRPSEIAKRGRGDQVNCAMCGGGFVARNSRHSYCSPLCSQNARISRLAEMRRLVAPIRAEPYARGI